MRKQSVQEWLSVLSAILLLPRFVDIPVERTLTQEVISCLLASEIPMFLTKAIAVKVQKQHWIDFQAVAKPQLSRVNQETMLILSSRCNIQVHTQYVSLQYPRIFKTDLGSLDPSYRENLLELGVFGFSLWLCFGEEVATHSSILAWRIPGTEEPGGLPFMGLHRVRHDWSDLAAAAVIMFSFPTVKQVRGNCYLQARIPK